MRIAPNEYASLDDTQAWANSIMDMRKPDVIIGDDYLRRWWIAPRNQGPNTYLHEILRSDDERAMHDHPWNWTSYIIDGGYIEHTPDGRHIRKAGDIVTKLATDLHRLEIPKGGRAVTLFTTGPIIREWGFACPQGWRHWRDFTASDDPSQIGRGCE